eukprot:964679_1
MGLFQRLELEDSKRTQSTHFSDGSSNMRTAVLGCVLGVLQVDQVWGRTVEECINKDTAVGDLAVKTAIVGSTSNGPYEEFKTDCTHLENHIVNSQNGGRVRFGKATNYKWADGLPCAETGKFSAYWSSTDHYVSISKQIYPENVYAEFHSGGNTEASIKQLVFSKRNVEGGHFVYSHYANTDLRLQENAYVFLKGQDVAENDRKHAGNSCTTHHHS